MTCFKFIVVGSTQASFLKEGEQFYIDRLKHYIRLEWFEVKGSKIKKGVPDLKILDAEAEAICSRLNSSDYIVTLDSGGTSFSSETFALHMQKLIMKQSHIALLIGGPLGLAPTLLSKSMESWSLSKMTFTHEMTRLIILEQVYRAFTILNGEKYHK